MSLCAGEHRRANGSVRGLRGRLITIEGIDGAGKSTLASALHVELERVRPVALLREPGGVALSERIRELVKDPALRCDARAEALLYAAARAQLVDERLRPLLEGGTWVLLDRFVDSSLVYQGVGRGLGIHDVAGLNAFATGDLSPDRTLLLRVDAAAGRARQRERPGTPDRLEREGDAFFAAIARAYDELAATHPQRICVIDQAGARRPRGPGRAVRLSTGTTARRSAATEDRCAG
jgi:dTMP kinase